MLRFNPFFLLLFTIFPVWAETSQVISIDSRLELFVNSFLIDQMKSTELRLHEPQIGESVLKFDKPWEGLHCGYVTVVQDGDLYRLYYRGLPVSGKDGSNDEVTCYTESHDGIEWTRPNLGLFEVKGTRENNVILAGMAPYSHNFSPFLDTRPDVSTEEKYKALAGTSETGLHVFVSPDGIRWKKWLEDPVIRKGAFDSQNVGFWSESEQCYVCYFRTWSEGGYKGIRTVSRSTSTDFLNWSDPESMSFGGTPLEHLYTNQTLPYFRAPHLYIALAARFMPGRRVITAEQMAALGGAKEYSGDISDTVFMTSRGGNVYDRTFMEGFIRPGIGPENWTSRTNYPARGIVPAGRDKIAFYIQRRYGQADHFLQRLVLRTDGFVSVHAPYAGGEMLTKVLKFGGKSLVLNESTSAAGSIRVEIQDETGSPIPGFGLEECHEIIGDEIARVVTWNNGSDVSSLAGKPVRLRFLMKDADLYSMRFMGE